MSNDLSLLGNVAQVKKFPLVKQREYIGFETVFPPPGSPQVCPDDQHQPEIVTWDEERFGPDTIGTKEGVIVKELFRCRLCKKIEWIHVMKMAT